MFTKNGVFDPPIHQATSKKWFQWYGSCNLNSEHARLLQSLATQLKLPATNIMIKVHIQSLLFILNNAKTISNKSHSSTSIHKHKASLQGLSLQQPFSLCSWSLHRLPNTCLVLFDYFQVTLGNKVMPVKLNIILQSSIYKMHGKTGYSVL